MSDAARAGPPYRSEPWVPLSSVTFVSHPLPFSRIAQEVGTSVTPSSEKRPSKPPKVGFLIIFPASRHSPCEKICEICAMSAAKFVFISRRVSHWERTLAWILLGRWEATSK